MFCIHKFRWPNIKWQSYDQAVTGQDEEIQVPVLIVGGSLVGLSTALLLARHGVESLVVERHSGTAIHPRAGHFNLRTLEILRSAGLEDTVRRKSREQYPPDGGISNVESLAGREIATYSGCSSTRTRSSQSCGNAPSRWARGRDTSPSAPAWSRTVTA